MAGGPPLLLVSASLPGAPGVGGIVLGDLLALPGAPPVVPFARPAHGERPAPAGTLARRFHAALHRLGALQGRRLAAYARHALDSDVAAVAGEARAIGARALWLVANNPEIILLGARLVREGHDVRLMVWDDPAYLADGLRLSRGWRARIGRDFATLVSGARQVAVVSEAMKARYDAAYASDALVFRHAVAPERLQPWKGADTAEGAPLRLVLAGSLYAKAEWNALVRSLERARWRIAGRAVELHFAGHFPALGARRPDALVDHGYLSADAARALLATMDIGYLPYWFDPARQTAATTSFPGKLSAYAEAGLAIFNHGPATTEQTGFLAAHPFGASCASLDPDAILAALGGLAATLGSAERAAGWTAAVTGELSRERLSARLARFVAAS